MADVERYDAVVIGSGTGGYPAAIRLGQLGVKTLIIEKQNVGGVCLNVGCIPSKSLIHAAKMIDKVKHLGDIGIGGTTSPTIDMAATQKWKETVVGKLTGGVRQLLKANKTTLMEGYATFVGPNALEVKKSADAEVFAAALARYSVFYQPAGDARVAAPQRRLARMAAPAPREMVR